MDVIFGYIRDIAQGNTDHRKRIIIYTENINDRDALRLKLDELFSFKYKLQNRLSVGVECCTTYISLSPNVNVIANCSKYDHMLFYRNQLND